MSAPLALEVKMTTYSSSEALKKRNTARRAWLTSSVDALEVGLLECGLPYTPSISRR